MESALRQVQLAEEALILANAKLLLAKYTLETLQSEDKFMFKKTTDAIQTIQHYAIYHGISLGQNNG